METVEASRQNDTMSVLYKLHAFMRQNKQVSTNGLLDSSWSFPERYSFPELYTKVKNATHVVVEEDGVLGSFLVIDVMNVTLSLYTHDNDWVLMRNFQRFDNLDAALMYMRLI